jgi:hypothetical protein
MLFVLSHGIEDLPPGIVAVGDKVLNRFELTQAIGELLHVEIHARIVPLVRREIGRRLGHIKRPGLPPLKTDTAQERDLQPTPDRVIARAPETIQAIGLLAAFSDETTVEDPEATLRCFDDLFDQRAVKGQPVEVFGEVAAEGLLGGGAVAGQVGGG